jgi:uroporphyrinogen-III synthase
MAKHKVLSTKKLEPSLIGQAKENDIEIIEQEAIKTNPILSKEKWQEIFQLIESKKEFIVFTSSNAVLSVKKYLNEYINPFQTNWKIFSLSGKTKETLEENTEDFGTIISTVDNSKTLAEKIVDAKVDEVIFFCGNKRRDELPNILKEAGIKVHEVVVYETIETPIIVNDDFDAILFFSPSAVQSFFSVNQLKNNTACFAIGATTANSIASFTDNKIIVSELPSQEKMLALVNFYFQNTNCHE